MRPQRHIVKNIKNRYVRPVRRRLQLKIEQDNTETVTPQDKVKKENKEIKREEMNNIDINQVDALLQSEGEKLPKRKVKVEKKDKGILERTENSRVILTEDNKMLLND